MVRLRTMNQELIDKLKNELEEGMGLEKCRKCGCMKDALNALEEALPQLKEKGIAKIAERVDGWVGELEEQKYK